MSLIDQIRMAQRDAGEAAVMADLKRKGLLIEAPKEPPEADKLLQQALEAVLDEHLPGFTEDAPRQHDDVIYDKAIEDAADAIQQLIARTYLEGK